MPSTVSAPAPSLRIFGLTTLVSTAIATLYAVLHLPPDAFVQLVISFAPIVAIATWLRQDARLRGVPLLHDFGFFVLIAWPVLIPWYLVKTRGVHALPFAFVLVVATLGPPLVSIFVAVVRLLSTGVR